MRIKKRGLGRGLSDLGLNELLSDSRAPMTAVADRSPVSTPAQSTPTQSVSSAPIDHQYKQVSINQLKPGPYQPRKVMEPEALQELANSIRQQGMIQPIVVRENAQRQYEIIAGERRWRAARLAELTTVPVIVRDVSNETAMAMALIENIQRRDLNAIEEASALGRLLEEFNMTHQEVADAVGKSRANVTNLLRLLKLNPDVQALVERGQLDMGHARALLILEGIQQSEVAKKIVDRGLSVRETETWIRQLTQNVAASSTDAAPSGKTVLYALQDRLMQKLGIKVAVIQNAKGRGKLILKYNSEAELEKILLHIR